MFVAETKVGIIGESGIIAEWNFWKAGARCEEIRGACLPQENYFLPP